jgi:hypothetical protein
VSRSLEYLLAVARGSVSGLLQAYNNSLVFDDIYGDIDTKERRAFKVNTASDIERAETPEEFERYRERRNPRD